MSRLWLRLPSILVIPIIFAVPTTPVAAAEGEQPCWKDYPIHTTPVDYRRELAAGMLLPDEIVVDSHTIKVGMRIERLSAVMGMPSREAEVERRSAIEQCEYLFALLQDHPTSMHLYKLSALGLNHQAGAFGVVDWDIKNIGSIRAFWWSQSDSSNRLVYMLGFSPLGVESNDVRALNSVTFSRAGPPRIDWDIELNRVTVFGHR